MPRTSVRARGLTLPASVRQEKGLATKVIGVERISYWYATASGISGGSCGLIVAVVVAAVTVAVAMTGGIFLMLAERKQICM